MSHNLLKFQFSERFKKIKVNRYINSIIIFFLSTIIITSFIIPVVNSQSEQNIWEIMLYFSETNGKKDYLIFGESLYASDSIDNNDVPDPGVPPSSPYLNVFFTSSFDNPYSQLMQEFKHFSYDNNYKIWNLTLLWDGNENTNITIDWNLTDYNQIEYDSILLCNDTGYIIDNMLVNNSYTFNCLPLTPQHFKIICTIYYTLNLNTIGDGAIIINKNEPYIHGESVILEAVPSNNFVFSKWSGDLSTNTNPITITMDSNKSINAHFVKKSSGGKTGGGGGVLPPENMPPIADASAGEPYEGFIAEEILFDGSLSYDQDTDTIISWYWQFGDGYTDDGEVVNHTYFIAGDYTVNLTVTDNQGAIDTDTVYVVITNKLNNVPSKPFLEGPTSGNKNVSYSYYISVYDEDNDPIKYFISWGDNTNTTTDFLTNNNILYNHTWTTPGKYIMGVQAFDDKEASSEKTHLTILIDVTPISGEINGDLIDEDSDGIYDYFYHNLMESKTKLGLDSEGQYLIDSTGNNKYDFVYNFETGELTDFISDESDVYTPEEFNIWIFVIVLISLISLFISLIYMKKS